MRRTLAALLGLLVLVAAAYGYTMTRHERLYRQNIVEGELAMGRGDTFAALSAFSDAITLKPDSMLGYLKRGEVRYRRGELDAAAEDLSAASAHDGAATRAYELRGDVDVARQLPDRAAEHYAHYVRLDDRSPRVLYKLGLARMLAGQTAEAAEALSRAVSLDNRLTDAYYLLGVCLRELRRPADAHRSLERAIALSPASIAAREQLADFFAASGNRQGRIQQLEWLLRGDPKPGRQIALAGAYAQDGQITRAVRLLGSAAERYPDHAETYVALGRIWLEVARPGNDRVALGKAIEALQHAASMEPTSEAIGLLGEARALASDLPLAERTLQQATQKLPADRATFLHLANAAERTGHAAVARAALLDYYALLDPADRRAAETARRIADLSARLGDRRASVIWQARSGDRK
jgi:tetratricopeptide (TPR) repeat protein